MFRPDCGMPMPAQSCCIPRIQPKCRVIHRYNCVDLCHVCPVHTHVVNHQICRHHYVPKYTCSQETCCQDLHCGGCCQY